ncbi:MAG: HNH endonuclease signature motif containing protein [Pseudonocardia sp.]
MRSAPYSHHILEWEHGGRTDIDNVVMLCRFHHRLLHHPGWIVRIRDSQPEFIPPKWIDTQQIPLRRPPPSQFREISSRRQQLATVGRTS